MTYRTYDRRPVIRRYELQQRVNLTLGILIGFAIGCGIAAVTGW